MKKTLTRRAPKNGTAVVKVKAALPVRAAEGVRAITAVDPQALIAQAIARGLPDVSMERLFAMRKEMEAERAKKAYFVALAGFQNECPVIAKAKKVPNKKKEGEKEATTKYAYAPIEDIVVVVKDLFQKWGFSYTFKSRQAKGEYTAICIAHHQEGHEEATEFTVPTDFPEYMNMSGAQEQGASCTYADRYAFKNAFGIVTKGDDTDAVRPDEGSNRKTPIRQPQEKGPIIYPRKDGTASDTPIPVAHEVKKEPEKLSDYDKILKYTKATAFEPKTKQTVAIFTENEQIDYTSEANQAKNDPEALKRIGAEMVETWKKRERAIKGEA